MTAFLMSTGEDPITLSEIKRAIGLCGPDHDATIKGIIGTGCSMHACRPSKWMIECDDMFEANLKRKGRVLKMGQEEIRSGKPYRIVHFAPEQHAIVAAKAFIARMCRGQRDILETIEAEGREAAGALAVAAE